MHQPNSMFEKLATLPGDRGKFQELEEKGQRRREKRAGQMSEGPYLTFLAEKRETAKKQVGICLRAG